jgi:hypothetical protein
MKAKVDKDTFIGSGNWAFPEAGKRAFPTSGNGSPLKNLIKSTQSDKAIYNPPPVGDSATGSTRIESK